MSYRRTAAFLIVCPLALELKALAKAFRFDIGIPGEDIVPGSASTYLGELDGKKIVVMKLSRPGVLSAACETAHALLHVDPECVVSFGIAGKLSSEVNLRDVVFAETVDYYEPAKETVVRTKRTKKGRQVGIQESVFVPRTDPFPTDARLRSVLRGVPSSCWNGFSVYVGPIASGEKLVADIASVTRMRIKLTVHDKCLAVEMEAAGVAAAVEWFQSLDGDESIPAFIALKGMSDDATVKKSLQVVRKKLKGEFSNSSQNSETQEHPDRTKAAENAAQVLSVLVGRAKNVINRPVIDKLGQIKQTFEAVGCALNPIHADYKQVELGRLLHTAKRRIPVFYHWEQRTLELHWIDFLHLTVLKHFPTKYFQPRPLVSIAEESDPEHIRQMIERVCGEKPTFSHEMMAVRDISVGRAKSLGWDQAAYINARQTLGKPGDQNKGGLYHEDWMQYMVSQSGEIGGCFVVIWNVKQPLYEALFRSYSINSCLAVSGDILLGKKKGKFEDPGKDLFVQPGEYSAIRQWAENGSPEEISEFASMFGHDVDEWLKELSKSGVSSTRTNAQSSPTDVVKEVIAAWDYLYFYER